MSTNTIPEARPQEWRGRFPTVNYLNADYGIKSWLLTKDHKRIGILYLISVSFFFAIGGAYALAIRMELLTPAGDLMQSHTYNKVFTHHGIMMVFFFLIPAIPGVLGNFLLPLMIGAKDMAFPKINMLSWYIFMAGGIFIFLIFFSSILTGLNFFVTTHTMRAPGITWFRLPLFVWSHYATALIMIL